MFDLDLQESIREVNADFLAYAAESASSRPRRRERVALSDLEDVVPGAGLEQLSSDALELNRRAASITDVTASPAFARRLIQQGLLKLHDGQASPTGFGLLLFGNEPRAAMPQAGVLGTIHLPDGTEEPRDFASAQVLAPQQALEWLRNKLPDPVSRSDAQRRRINDAFFEMVREGIVNALVHRDYGIRGANVPVGCGCGHRRGKKPWRTCRASHTGAVAGLQRAHAEPKPGRALCVLADGAGRGARPGPESLRRRAQEAGLPLPTYASGDPYLGSDATGVLARLCAPWAPESPSC